MNGFPSAYYTQAGGGFYDYNIDVEELTENSARAIPPPNCNVMLKPHQLSLLQRCIEFENNSLPLTSFPSLAEIANPEDCMKTKVGVIGDRVGSGKSYVILALMNSNDITTAPNYVVKSYGYNNVVLTMKEVKNCIPTNLLVIPHNLATQWETYIQRYKTNAKYFMISKTKSLEKIVSGDEKLEDYPMVVVTSTFYQKFANWFDGKNLRFQRVFYDEVDSLHIPGCKQIDAKFYWLVTASYGNVLYPRGFSKWEASLHRYIWCANGLTTSGYIKNMLVELSTYVPKSLLKILVVKNSEGFVEQSLQLPAIFRNMIKCKTPQSIQILHGLVERNIIECLNANDVQGALQYINPNQKSSEDNIISILIDKYNKQLGNLNVRLEMAHQFEYDTEQEKQVEIVRITKKIEEMKEKIQLIKDRVSSSDSCAICYDEIQGKTITQCCQNPFCFKCIHLWMNQRNVCPMCKAPMDAKSTYVVSEEQASSSVPNTDEEIVSLDEVHEKHDKYTNLEIVLSKRAPGSKILIFSNFDNSFTQIYGILAKLNIRYEHLKGNSAQINCTLNRYKNGGVDVLMINTRYYGSGLNLENTSDIMMFHKFDSEIEKQVIGRAHRMGRTDPLRLWYFLHENEMHS